MREEIAAAKYAVDFVILPPEPVGDLIIALNKKHCNDSTIALNKDHCIPHISLLMGCIRYDQLKEATALLRKIVTNGRTMKLDMSHIRTVSTASGDVMALDVETNEPLQRIHESLVETFTPLITTNATPSDTYDGLKTNFSTLNWINNFLSQSCGENFWPHITIGYLKDQGISEIDPVSFQAFRFAICHLGNYCTCKRILAEVLLP